MKLFFVVLFFALGLFLTRPNAETVQKCVDVTGWSVERCAHEISR